MKKVMAIILAVVLAGAFAAASAQEIEIHREAELFYFTVTLPGGARIASSTADEILSKTVLEYITDGKPTVVITVAPDETYIGQSMADLSKEEISLIINGIAVEMTGPSTDVRTTLNGNEYLVINETTSVNDTCDTVMLINGYFIIINVTYDDFRELTPEDQEIGPSIVETFRFIGNTNS